MPDKAERVNSKISKERQSREVTQDLHAGLLTMGGPAGWIDEQTIKDYCNLNGGAEGGRKNIRLCRDPVMRSSTGEARGDAADGETAAMSGPVGSGAVGLPPSPHPASRRPAAEAARMARRLRDVVGWAME